MKPVELGFENTETERFLTVLHLLKLVSMGSLSLFCNFFPKEKPIYQTPLPSFIPGLLPRMPRLRTLWSEQGLSLMMLLVSGERHLAEGVAAGS